MNKDYLIEKWLNDDLTAAEQEAFSKLEDYQLHLDILDKAKHFKASQFSKVDDFDTFYNTYQAQNTRRKINWMYPMLRIASVLVIGFAIYFSFFYNKLTHIETLAKEKTTIQLPDDSEVTLNARSEITFNRQKWDKKRSLKLDGEAYFKVEKGNTFDVITTDGLVTVVGTEFNVKQRENYFEVVCFEGLVRVTSDTITRLLNVGDTYRILNDEFVQDEVLDTFPHWTQNRSSFNSVPFNEVLAELERQYDIEVAFMNVDINRLFSGGFTHDNIENALISITQPMDLTYEMSASNQVVIHGDKQ